MNSNKCGGCDGTGLVPSSGNLRAEAPCHKCDGSGWDSSEDIEDGIFDVCGRCAGHGTIQGIRFNMNDSGFTSYKETCPQCGGDGLMRCLCHGNPLRGPLIPPCPQCEGTGSISGWPDTPWERCPVCVGTGVDAQ